MFLRIGKEYMISLPIKNISGDMVTDDYPYATIKDTDNNNYWNGIMWSGQESRIYLTHMMNGVYQHQIVIDKPGTYEIVSKSDMYDISKTETLEIYDESLAYKWRVGEPFTIKHFKSSEEDTLVKIMKNMDETYYHNDEWFSAVETNTMVNVDGVSTFTFTPEESAKYQIVILDGDKEIFMMLDVGDNELALAPVSVSHASIKSNDGTDCTILTEKGSAIPGVKVTAFDPITKESKGQVATDNFGEWNMFLTPGVYYFMFEKDGYISLSIEREVL